ncbi:NAD-binding protein [Desulfurococcaceae archaeon MEX13E-LK6-19]|nr:NAD-binding protein [Desulfurococcaceae archaeon MEX13E-LK6-19]
MRILIVGGGMVAEELLERLDLRSNEVFVVENNPERSKSLTQKYDITVINRDATDVSLYTSEIRMDEIDAVIALTGKDEINLFVLAIAKIYNVPIRMAKVTSTRLAEFLQSLGLGIPICQPSLVSTMISNYLNSIREPWLLGVVGEHRIYLIALAETDIAVGQKISELGLPEDVHVVLVFDGSSIYFPGEEFVLKPGYQILVLSKTSDVVKYFKG